MHGIQVYSPPVESDDEETTLRNMNMMVAYFILTQQAAHPSPQRQPRRSLS
jgi:hypothetical protein